MLTPTIAERWKSQAKTPSMVGGALVRPFTWRPCCTDSVQQGRQLPTPKSWQPWRPSSNEGDFQSHSEKSPGLIAELDETMAAHTDTLLRYRPWRGEPHGPLFASVAMARVSLKLMLRRKLLWGLFALGLLVFFFFFYAQYLVVWITNQLATETVRFAGIPVTIGNLTKFLERLNLNGTAHTFGNFVWFQGYVLVIVLALAGSVLVGNDFFHGSLPFYLSKPISRWHYVLGKCLAIGVFVNLMTTIPSMLLWLEAGLLYDWKTYYLDNLDLLLGILGYGTRAVRHAESAGGRDGGVGAADGADGDGLDGPLHLPAHAGRVAHRVH